MHEHDHSHDDEAGRAFVDGVIVGALLVLGTLALAVHRALRDVTPGDGGWAAHWGELFSRGPAPQGGDTANGS